MPVSKMYGYPGCTKTSPVVVSPKAPVASKPEHNPKPTTARGRRRAENRKKAEKNQPSEGGEHQG
jgi:hypothetical protein